MANSTKIVFLGLLVLVSSSLISANRVLLEPRDDNKDGDIETTNAGGGVQVGGNLGFDVGVGVGVGIGKGGHYGGGGGVDFGGAKGGHFGSGVTIGGGIGGKGGFYDVGKGGHPTMPVIVPTPTMPVAPVGGGKGGYTGGSGSWTGGGSWDWSGGGGGSWTGMGACAACPPQCLKAYDQAYHLHNNKEAMDTDMMDMDMEESGNHDVDNENENENE